MKDKQEKQALTVYRTLCDTLDRMDWKYDADDETLMIDSGAQGDDLPIDVRMRVNPKNQLVSFMSTLPFTVPAVKRRDMAVAVSMVNYLIVNGSFDYDYTSGRILFRMTNSFRESLLGAEMLKYMIQCATWTVDEYNDQLFAVSKGMLSADDFVKKLMAD